MKKLTFQGRMRGKPHATKLVALLIGAMFMLCPSSAALAAIHKEIVDVPRRDAQQWRITTFEGEMPSDIGKALAEGGFEDYSCYSGAMVEELADTQRKNSGEQAEKLEIWALVALEKGDERILVGMTYAERKWGHTNLGEKALLPGRDFTIGATDSGFIAAYYLPLRFTIAYTMEDGGIETYGLYAITDKIGEAPLWNVWHHEWYVTDYTRLSADGEAYSVLNAEGAFQVVDAERDMHDDGNHYSAYLPFLVKHMDSIADFPTSDEEAKRVAEESWAKVESLNFGLTSGGVNFRKEATVASDSLGKMRNGVPMLVLGEREGVDAPWYHVRLGLLEGYISGIYLSLPQTLEFERSMSHHLVTVAKAAGPITLRDEPREGATGGTELPEGTLMHVLMDAPCDWLYVMVPSGDIGWEVDMNGTGGYVRVTDVVQGY